MKVLKMECNENMVNFKKFNNILVFIGTYNQWIGRMVLEKWNVGLLLTNIRSL